MISIARVAAFFRERLVFAKLASLVLWLGYVITILLGDGHGTFNMLKELFCADHLAFYTAARLVREGRPEDVYNNETVAKYQHDLFPERWNSLEAFRNPPFYALLYLPTANWPYVLSAWFWFIVSVLAITATNAILVHTLRRQLGNHLNGITFPRALLWTFTFYPIFCALSYGQNTPLSMLIFAGTYVFLSKDRPFAAGLLSGLLWYKPTLLLGLGLWALLDIRRKWPCMLGSVLTAAVLSLGSYLIAPALWVGFISNFARNAAYADFEQWKMHNPLAFFRLLLPESEWPGLKAWHMPLAAVCSLVAIIIFIQLWRKCGNQLHIMFGAVVYLTLIASPHALIYEWALLAITGLLWFPAMTRQKDRWFLVMGLVWLASFVSTAFCELQGKLSPVMVQISVPIFGWAFWWASRQFRRDANLIKDEKLQADRSDALAEEPAGEPPTAT